MKSDELKSLIENRILSLSTDHMFFKKSSSDGLKTSQIVCHIKNLQYVVRQTPRLLKLAAHQALSKGFTEISQYYLEKAPEEQGHDLWAKDDIINLGNSPKEDEKPETQAPLKLINYLEQTIQSDPRLYIVYMTFVEYMIIMLAPSFLQAVETKSGIKKENVSIISKHYDADKNHVAEDFKAITNFLDDHLLDASIVEVLDQSVYHVGECFTEALASGV